MNLKCSQCVADITGQSTSVVSAAFEGPTPHEASSLTSPLEDMLRLVSRHQEEFCAPCWCLERRKDTLDVRMWEVYQGRRPFKCFSSRNYPACPESTVLQKSGSEGRSHHSNGLFPLRELGSVCYTPVKLAARAGRSGRLWIFSTQAEQALRGRRDLKTFLACLSLKAAVSTVFLGPKSELGRPSVSTRRLCFGFSICTSFSAASSASLISPPLAVFGSPWYALGPRKQAIFTGGLWNGILSEGPYGHCLLPSSHSSSVFHRAVRSNEWAHRVYGLEAMCTALREGVISTLCQTRCSETE